MANVLKNLVDYVRGPGLAFLILSVFGSGASPAAAQKGKPIVAVYQMDDLAKSGQAATFSTMIETAIASTSKFRIIERERLNKLVGEQARAKGGLVTTNRPGSTGGFEGVDFLVYGTITTVSVVNKADIGSTMVAGLFSRGDSGPSCSNAFVTMGVDIKITDAHSGEIRYVTRIDERQKSASACGDNPTIDTAALMRSAAEKVATGLVTAIYPIQIASLMPDGSVVLNYGEGTIQPGTTMAVYAKGQAIVDPATGEVIGNNETRIGFVRISEINGRVSKAIPVGEAVAALSVGSIVRPATTADIQMLIKAGKKRK